MAEAVFNYEGINTSIQCNLDDKMKDIIANFLNKIKEKGDNFFYLYNGSEINKDLTFNDQANDLDKNRQKMNIIVTKNDSGINANEKNEVISKDIVCPECKENSILNITNHKILFYGCKNKHNITNISFDDYEESQKIDISKIICDICKINNKSITHNNEFYICNTCNKNMCPLCKSSHYKNHMIINYDDKNYICKKHNDSFTKFCKTCNEDICIICENEHKNHDKFDFSSLIINKDELLKSSEDLKNIIDNFKYKIDIIKEILDNMINIMNTYYKLNNNMINNYNMNKRNYHKLQNLNNLKNNNDKIINDINNIINSNQIFEINKES